MRTLTIDKLRSEASAIATHAVVLLLCIFATVTVPVLAQTFPWQSYTNTDDVRDIVWHDDRVWCATSGGLMAYRLAEQTFQVWTNSEGLTFNDLQAIGVDQWDRIWVGMSNGDINIIDPADNSVTLRDDMESEVFEITVIDTLSGQTETADLRWILVGADQGLTIYQQGNGPGNVQVVESIPRFGNFPSPPHRVSDLVVLGRDIWVSTAYGVATASADSAPLRPPTVWTSYDINDGLPQNDVLALANWQGTVVAGTQAGAARFNGHQFEQMGAVLAIEGLYASADNLWAWTAAGLYWWNGSAWELQGGNHINISSLARDTQSRLWAGHVDDAGARGSLAYLDNQWSDRIIRNGLSWNRVNALYIDSQERLWIGGDGLNLLDADGWHNWTWQSPLYSESFFASQGRAITEDALGGFWAGSFGGGVINIRDISNDTLIYDYYGYTGNADTWLIGIPGFPSFVVVQGLTHDNAGNVWIVNRGATNGKMLVQVPESYVENPTPSGPNTWTYYSVLEQNLDADQENLLIDGYGRIWVAGGDANDSPGKIYVLDPAAETPSFREFSFEDALFVNQMAIDQSGTIWFATRDGIRYAIIPQDLDLFNMQPLYGGLSGNVQCVHVDAQNNKWFGTDHGISVLSAAFAWSLQFPADEGPVPYGLVAPNVQRITSNYATGDVWIATTSGLSRVRTPYRVSSGPLSSIRIYPNPFVIGNGNFLRFSTVDFHRALIYTITGKRIRDLSAVEAITGWDGRDSDGDLVGSGIYLILVTNPAGDSKLGKVAVIR